MLHQMLLGVAGHRDARVVLEAVEQDAYLERREILDLVDGDMPILNAPPGTSDEWADAQLPCPQEQCVVLGIERGIGFGITARAQSDLLETAPVPVHESIQVPVVASGWLQVTLSLSTSSWLAGSSHAG